MEICLSCCASSSLLVSRASVPIHDLFVLPLILSPELHFPFMASSFDPLKAPPPLQLPCACILDSIAERASSFSLRPILLPHL
ncbi:tRNA 4-demethylwyosine synthase (AdoMet-dependent) [Psidium guajava]|nr:tRNA 4-demethylwyosine synthase (AdoMet-dependent) [Psidium guajava]